MFTLGGDQIELVAGSVVEHDSGTGMGRVAGFSVVEDLGDHIMGPPRCGFGVIEPRVAIRLRAAH
jgi:hypothetical protein